MYELPPTCFDTNDDFFYGYTIGFFIVEVLCAIGHPLLTMELFAQIRDNGSFDKVLKLLYNINDNEKLVLAKTAYKLYLLL